MTRSIASPTNRLRRAAGVVVAIVLTAFISIGAALLQTSENAIEMRATDSPDRRVQRAAIDRGRYLVIAGNCYACHTSRDDEPFAGGVEFNTAFGVIYSRNITPHPVSGIGRWTERAFIRSLHEGTSANGEHLYPAFPYPSYTKIAENDVRDIFAYLSTIDPVNSQPPDNELRFPFKFRALLGVWKWLFLDNERFVADPSKPSEINRGAYLVEALAHCGACHSPRNAFGAGIDNEALTGGIVVGAVSSDERRPRYAVDLTPAKSGLKSWSEDELVEYLRSGYSMSRAVSFGQMNEVIGHSTRYMTSSDLHAMAAYLKRLPERTSQNSRFSIDKMVMQQGSVIYESHCGTCHLPTGLGDPAVAPPLAGSAIVQSDSPLSLINLILYGAYSPPPTLLAAPESLDDFKHMSEFGNKLDPGDIAKLATFVRNAWGNTASPVTVEQVEAQY